MDATRTDVVRSVGERYGTRIASVIPEFPRELEAARFPPGAGPFAAAAGKAAWHRMAPTDRALLDAAFVSVGRLIAAYETTLAPGRSRFDDYADALAERNSSGLAVLTDEEKHGLRLFLDVERTQCLQCHSGALFTNGAFHNIGTGPDAADRFDYGRAFGLQSALFNPFNCLGAHGPGADSPACAHLRFAQSTRLPPTAQGAFKVPGLRNVAETAPYSHDGRFATLEAVMHHYLNPPAPDRVPHELRPLELSESEVGALVEFLGTLTPVRGKPRASGRGG
jgi:cytochrome c peroxidase